MSDNEGMTPDPSLFSGLFWPDLFKSLLHKAKGTANLGADPAPETARAPADSGHMLFSEPTFTAEVVPSPKLFLDVTQR